MCSKQELANFFFRAKQMRRDDGGKYLHKLKEVDLCAKKSSNVGRNIQSSIK
jgi:hypothetical protein